MHSVKKIADNVAMINEGEIIWKGKKSEMVLSKNQKLQEFINEK